MVCAKTRKIIAIMAFITGIVCSIAGLGAAGASCALASELTPTEQPPQPVLENITNLNEFILWYEAQLNGKNTVGILSQDLIINKPVELKALSDTAAQHFKDKEQTPAQIELRIQSNPNNPADPISTIRIVGTGSLTVDNPNLLISGTHHLFSVEGSGKLILNNGTILAQDRTQASIFTVRGKQVTINRACKGFKDLIISSTDGQDPNTPDESQNPDGGDIENTKPELTEALLLNIGSDGSGTARLTFENIPSDITGLYIYRSETGKSWNKEKNKLEASISQGAQGTVEYENFLKEPGNILNNTGIIEDGCILYHFQSDNNSFYVKAEIEHPGKTWETQKLKVAVPNSAGQGFDYSWGGYSSYGGSYSYGSYGNTGGGSSGYLANNKNQDNAGGETDAPEGPVRRGGRRRSTNYPEVYQTTEATDSTDPAEVPIATSSIAGKAGNGTDGNLAGESTKEGVVSDQSAGPDIENMPESAEPPEAGQTSEVSENQDSSDEGTHKKIMYATGIFILILLCAGGIYYIHRTRKK